LRTAAGKLPYDGTGSGIIGRRLDPWRTTVTMLVPTAAIGENPGEAVTLADA
jgi:hypothetical protein